MTINEFKQWLAGYRDAKKDLDLADLTKILAKLDQIRSPDLTRLPIQPPNKYTLADLSNGFGHQQ